MSASVSTELGNGGAEREVFALTDEQILGMEPEGEVARGTGMTDEQLLEDPGTSTERGAAENSAVGKPTQEELAPREATAQVKENGTQAPPQWLAERMRDPWHGEEAKELWESAVQARQEAAAYREAIATPAEARALKEMYPGGVNEAKTALERARQLEEFDAAYFGTVGKPAEALSAARLQLAQRLMQQDPAAFREMVAAGVRLLEGKEVARGEWRVASDQEQKSGSLAGARDDNRSKEIAEHGPGAAQATRVSGQTAASVPPEVASRYASFEKATNAELEKSVGGAIARAMEQALPNLKSLDRAGRGGVASQGTPLQERLASAVREDVEAALKSDAQLGEQVARILGARRFDDTTRAQVVRVIDARAQQLVPGAVRRVVGSWTTATLGAKGKSHAAEADSSESRAAHENAVQAAPRPGGNNQSVGRKEGAESRRPARAAGRGRVDYGKLSDEQILDL